MPPEQVSRGTHAGLPDAVINVVSKLSDADADVDVDVDFDEDGDVDGRDFVAWQPGLGVGNEHIHGDANFEESVDGDVLAEW